MKLASYPITLIVLFFLTACNNSKNIENQNVTSQQQSEEYFDVDTSSYPTYKVAVENVNYTPFLIMDEDDEENLTGFDIDLIIAIAEAAKFNIEFVSVDFESIFDAIIEDKADLAIDGLTETDERKEKYLASNPYLKSTIGYLVKKNAPEKLASDIEGKKVAVETGSYQEILLKKMENQEIINKDTTFLAFKSIFSGEAYTALGEKTIMLYESTFFENDYPMRFIPLSSKTDKLVVYGNKDKPEIIDKVNEGLSLIIENGTYQMINNGWFGINANEVAINN